MSSGALLPVDSEGHGILGCYGTVVGKAGFSIVAMISGKSYL